MTQLPIGILACGEFRRLAQHLGWLLGLLRSDLPRPKKVTGSSCGATALILYAMCAKYYEQSPSAGEIAAKRVTDVIENLRIWHIFTMPGTVARALGFTILAGLMPMGLEMVWAPAAHMPWRLLLGLVWVGTVVNLMWTILKAPAIFSTWPLRMKTLFAKIDWQAVFDSPVEVEVITTDCRTGKSMVYSTKDPRNQDPLRMATILCQSMRLPGTFQDYLVDDIAQVDAEISTNFAIERFCQPGERYGAVFFIPYTLEGDWPKCSTHFMADISRSMSMQIYRHLRRKLKRYRRLLARDRILASRFRRAPRLPRLYVALTTEQIPLLIFSSFSTKAMHAGVEQGGRIFNENYPEMKRVVQALGSAA